MNHIFINLDNGIINTDSESDDEKNEECVMKNTIHTNGGTTFIQTRPNEVV